MFEKIKEMLAEQFGCDPSRIDRNTSLQNDLGADSLDLFEMVLALEEEYSIDLPAEEVSELDTIGDVLDYLKEKGVNIN